MTGTIEVEAEDIELSPGRCGVLTLEVRYDVSAGSSDYYDRNYGWQPGDPPECETSVKVLAVTETGIPPSLQEIEVYEWSESELKENAELLQRLADKYLEDYQDSIDDECFEAAMDASNDAKESAAEARAERMAEERRERDAGRG